MRFVHILHIQRKKHILVSAHAATRATSLTALKVILLISVFIPIRLFPMVKHTRTLLFFFFAPHLRLEATKKSEKNKIQHTSLSSCFYGNTAVRSGQLYSAPTLFLREQLSLKRPSRGLETRRGEAKDEWNKKLDREGRRRKETVEETMCWVRQAVKRSCVCMLFFFLGGKNGNSPSMVTLAGYEKIKAPSVLKKTTKQHILPFLLHVLLFTDAFLWILFVRDVICIEMRRVAFYRHKIRADWKCLAVVWNVN